jgi:hypothetical protein
MQGRSSGLAQGVFIATVLCVPMAAPKAEPPELTPIGTLKCTAGASLGLTVGGRQRARCTFNAQTFTANYTGRFERSGRLAGIPSGSKLEWTVLAESGSRRDLSGRYQLPEHGGSGALCLGSPYSICLRPDQRMTEWNRNLALAIFTLRLERHTGPIRQQHRK